jgi:transcriptional regulator GlxA family with amidase domain
MPHWRERKTFWPHAKTSRWLHCSRYVTDSTAKEVKRMTPDGWSELMLQPQSDIPGSASAGRVEMALDILRADLLERYACDEWDENHAHEVAHAIVTSLRQNADLSFEEPRRRDPRLPREPLRRALRFISANLDSKLNWDRIACAAGMPPFVFGRSFKLTTGLAPHQYVIRCRIKRAMSLLASSTQSIADIALDVGCSCQSHLTTMFRKHTGTTPGRFRQSARRFRIHSRKELS